MRIFDLYEISNISIGPKNTYRIWTTCENNETDGEETEVDIKKDEFEKDELLLHVLSYVGKGYTGKFDEKWDDEFYGNHIIENEHFSWLGDYCWKRGLLAYSPDDPCHSIAELKVTYFDESGIKHNVKIPDFDTLFDTFQEAKEKMDGLYYGTAN